MTALRDRALLRAVRERLSYDVRFRDEPLDLHVRGGVVHARGPMSSRAHVAGLGEALRDVSGVHAAWDLVHPADSTPPRVLDVGCGGVKQVPEAVGVDRLALPGVDVVADLEEPLPFADGAFDHAFCVHVLEHVSDLVGLMGELHRVLAPTGVLHVLCPRWTHPNAWRDPTHVRGVDEGLFAWFCEGRPGVPPWRPLAVSADAATVWVDLERVETAPDPIELARWFTP